MLHEFDAGQFFTGVAAALAIAASAGQVLRRSRRVRLARSACLIATFVFAASFFVLAWGTAWADGYDFFDQVRIAPWLTLEAASVELVAFELAFATVLILGIHRWAKEGKRGEERIIEEVRRLMRGLWAFFGTLLLAGIALELWLLAHGAISISERHAFWESLIHFVLKGVLLVLTAAAGDFGLPRFIRFTDRHAQQRRWRALMVVAAALLAPGVAAFQLTVAAPPSLHVERIGQLLSSHRGAVIAICFAFLLCLLTWVAQGPLRRVDDRISFGCAIPTFVWAVLATLWDSQKPLFVTGFVVSWGLSFALAIVVGLEEEETVPNPSAKRLPKRRPPRRRRAAGVRG